jgi:hypothetical protein
VLPLWNSILVLKMGSLRVLTQDPSKTKVEVHHNLSKEISEFWKYAWFHHLWHIVPFDRNKKVLYISSMKYSDTEIRFQKSILTRKHSWCFGFYEKCLCLVVAKSNFSTLLKSLFQTVFVKKIHNYCINNQTNNIFLDFTNRDTGRADVMLTAKVPSVYLDDSGVFSYKCLKIRSCTSHRSFWKVFLRCRLFWN